VPGKKLRGRVTLVDAIIRPPRFEPQHAFHSLVYFPVVDGETLRSPTSKGQFLQYGLCHELGHVIAVAPLGLVVDLAVVGLAQSVGVATSGHPLDEPVS